MRGAMSRVLLLVLSFAACLAIAEIAVRTFDLGPTIRPVFRENFRLSANPGLGYELVPRSPDGEFHLNAFGMRGRELPLQKPKRTLRIAVVGDSIAFGFDVERGRGFGRVLERVLNRDFARSGVSFEVLNFGVAGYGVPQVVEAVRTKALRFTPDLIVYAYCLNDAQAYSLEMANVLGSATAAERGYLERAAADHSRLYALVRFGLHSLTADGRKVGEEALWHRDDPQFVAIEGGSYVRFFRDLYRNDAARGRVEAGFDALAEIARTRDIPMLVVVFPLLLDLQSYALAPIHEQLGAALEARSIASLDLMDVYRDQARDDPASLNVDPVHPSARGHRIAAVSILYALLANGWIPGEDLESFRGLEEREGKLSALAMEVRSVLGGA